MWNGTVEFRSISLKYETQILCITNILEYCCLYVFGFDKWTRSDRYNGQLNYGTKYLFINLLNRNQPLTKPTHTDILTHTELVIIG